MSAAWLGVLVGAAGLFVGALIIAPELYAFTRYVWAAVARWFD